MKRLERTDARGRDLQGHLARMDRRDLLARHVENLCGLLGLDSQTVKDVALLIAFNLRDRANDDAIRGDHVPPLPDLQPRDRISHHQRCFGHRAVLGSSASSAIEGTPWAKQSLIGTIKRANGARQVTYAGHPLYTYVLDRRRGQTRGEGSQLFGAGWDALAPSGKKIEADDN